MRSLFAVWRPAHWKVWIHLLPTAQFVPQQGDLELELRIFAHGDILVKHRLDKIHLGDPLTIPLHPRIPVALLGEKLIGVETELRDVASGSDLSSSAVLVEMVSPDSRVKFVPSRRRANSLMSRNSVTTSFLAASLFPDLRSSFLCINSSSAPIKLPFAQGEGEKRGEAVLVAPRDCRELPLPALAASEPTALLQVTEGVVELLRDELISCYRVDRDAGTGRLVSVLACD